jgi:hypothetical protein
VRRGELLRSWSPWRSPFLFIHLLRDRSVSILAAGSLCTAATARHLKAAAHHRPNTATQIFGILASTAGQLIDPAGTRNVGIRMNLYVHQGNQDSAYLAEIISGLGTTPVVSFKARFEDGFAFETNNVSNASIFKENPDHRSFRFPQVRSTDSLYRLHRRIKQDAVADHHHPIIADKQGELAEFVARAEALHQRMAQCGDYQLSLEGDCYRPTWKGAMRQSWLLAWPVKQIRAIRLQNNSLRVARELGLPINVKLGRIYEPADEDNPSH